MTTVESADGTVIAYDRIGRGSPLIVVGGATADRALTHSTAEALAANNAVTNFDRRGRGDSADTQPYEIEREIEDLDALIAEAGASAVAYGHSSGSALVLRAAAAGSALRAIILHEAPYSPDEEEMKEGARQWARDLEAMLGEGRNGDALSAFFASMGMPDEMVAEMRGTPRWAELERMAPTLAYDSAQMGDSEGAAVPVELAARIQAPALVLTGDEGPGWMIDVNRRLAAALPRGRLQVLEGEGHVVDPEKLAPVVEGFLEDV